MIGDGWDGDPSTRPTGPDDLAPGVRRVAAITGARSEFGLMRPVMRAIAHEPRLQLACIAAGSHLIAPAETFRDVKAAFNIADAVPMQIAGRTGRVEDAEALARGVGRFTRAFDRLRPDWILVLGDRIEAFAAACAASVGGWALAHIHGGDRAEGVADEAMRHAISKLAHVHFPATAQSADRLIRMGERPDRVFTVGSPAIDELAAIPPMEKSRFAELGSPTAVFLFHPIGRPNESEEAAAAAILEGLRHERVLALHPNHDPGRDGILHALAATNITALSHLPRDQFVGLLKRLTVTQPRGVLVGNSSAALIEAAALGVPAVDIGQRQAGRERCTNVIHLESERPELLGPAIAAARDVFQTAQILPHPYGDGHAGTRIAAHLAAINPHEPGLLRKHCAY
jgi:UDP-hydrolysing UDP-N-acetyl-D-glucosamine 2-epimerase